MTAKGTHLTAESRSLISYSLKNSPLAELARQRAHLARRGSHHSMVSKQKMSVSHKGKSMWATGKTKFNCSSIAISGSKRKGQKRSAATCLKMSIAKAGKPAAHGYTLPIRRKISFAKMGNKHSEDAKLKMSIAAKRRPMLLRPWPKGKSQSLETVTRRVRARAGYVTNTETRLKISQTLKGHSVSKETREKLALAAARQLQIRSPNKKERTLQEFLDFILPGEWKFVGNGELIIGSKCPDFANITGKKALIELYGDYWHRGENPQERISHFARYGYFTLIVWEHELEDTDTLIQSINGFIQQIR